MSTPTIENYTKRIWRLEEESEDGNVALGALAQSLGVTAGTVTSMLKTLSEAGLVDYRPRRGVRLTNRGRALALHVLRRHRIIELYLVNVLNMDWAEVHEEAEVLEHVVSDKVLKKMEEKLGDTSLDPHGSPIPDSDGVLKDSRDIVPLVDVESGEDVIIAKVREQNADFLDFLAKHHLKPGTRVRVKSVDQQAGILVLKPENKDEVTLSLSAAAGLDVH
ncbi:MAG: metal-dependent transcriptional regulator [Verrucomicrobia bacterium]|nr:metal-dependent transcriptional regulator [Verrucomicrobiota bacterium]MCH8510068.1 metal-dependent transcriptional regulator [Kiritimatiellia bacterium]